MATSKISEFLKAWFGPDDIHLGSSRPNRTTTPRPIDGGPSRPAPERLRGVRPVPQAPTERRPAPSELREEPVQADSGAGAVIGTSVTSASNVERLRFRGTRGGIIARHRSMRTVEMPRSEIVVSIALAIIATILWLWVMPLVLIFWARLFEFGRALLGIAQPVRIEPYHLGWFHFDLPSISLPSQPPGIAIWWITAIVTVVLFILSYPLGRRSIPWTYMLRAILFVQMTSLAFFAWAPVRFVYGLQDYMANLLMASLAFITIVPLVLSLTYYIFDVGLLKKLFLTFITLAHLCLLVPLQYLIHAFLIYHGSLLFMPVLYLVFGLSLDVMTFVAFYAWGMSWQSRNPQSAT